MRERFFSAPVVVVTSSPKYSCVDDHVSLLLEAFRTAESPHDNAKKIRSIEEKLRSNDLTNENET